VNPQASSKLKGSPPALRVRSILNASVMFVGLPALKRMRRYAGSDA